MGIEEEDFEIMTDLERVNRIDRDISIIKQLEYQTLSYHVLDGIWKKESYSTEYELDTLIYHMQGKFLILVNKFCREFIPIPTSFVAIWHGFMRKVLDDNEEKNGRLKRAPAETKRKSLDLGCGHVKIVPHKKKEFVYEVRLLPALGSEQ